MKKYVVINADDFGLSQGTNEGIIKAYQQGILTSTSLFATTPGFNQAVTLAKNNPDLGVGIHLSLTWGKSATTSQYFSPSYTRLIIKSPDKDFLKWVEKELEVQIEKVLATGLTIDHLNSQQHVHMIPAIYKIVIKLSKKYQIKFVRFSNEKFFLTLKWPEVIAPFYNTNLIKYSLMKFFSSFNKPVSKVDFWSLMYTTKMSKPVLKTIFEKIKPGITEILLHPARYKLSTAEKKFDFDKQRASGFMRDKTREMELATLIDSTTKRLVKRHHLVLTNYRQLANRR